MKKIHPAVVVLLVFIAIGILAFSIRRTVSPPNTAEELVKQMPKRKPNVTGEGMPTLNTVTRPGSNRTASPAAPPQTSGN